MNQENVLQKVTFEDGIILKIWCLKNDEIVSDTILLYHLYLKKYN